MTSSNIKWYQHSQDYILRELDTKKEGLDINKAEKRLKKYGKNQIVAQKSTNWFMIF